MLVKLTPDFVTWQRANGEPDEWGEKIVIKGLGHERHEAHPDDGRQAEEDHQKKLVKFRLYDKIYWQYGGSCFINFINDTTANLT